MSTTIDQRVVEMRFDNRQFESNVSTTMSTLEKLKQRLNFTGATKSLDGISASTKRVDLSGLSSGVEQVGLKFNAMYTMADQALRNITNSAMAAGKRMVSALTIDPIKTGLSEYETKINAIQVIKANTRGKNTMEEIEAALAELNEYADRTIYNFAQMTDNVGKFVAQGLDVNQAAKAVQGMANLAGASGASAADMARATYQMSQALGGVIRKMDWNSLRTANMASVELKNVITDLAKVKGIDLDKMIEKKGTFEDTLEEGWLTGELFTEAMNIYSDVYSEAELKAMGFKDAQIKNFKDLANMAKEATTEVKTFTQLWDVLKETAQSGWTQTWELIIGDFETSKKMWTAVQNYFSDIINAWSDARNFLIGGALDITAPWTAIMEKLNGAGFGKIKQVTESIMDVTDTIKYFQKVVNKVWRGDYKRSDTGRYQLLEAAGYDHRVVQDLVNLGYKHKITIEDIEKSHAKFGLTLNTTSTSTEEVAAALGELSDEQLKNAGLTDEEIKLYRDLEEEAKRTGVTIEELVDKMSKRDGRTLLIESFKNAWDGLLGVMKAIRNAWVEIFPPMTVVRLYSIIEGINKFSERLRLTDKDTGKVSDTVGKLERVFKGLFAVLDIVTTLLGGGLKIAFKILEQILNYFGMDVLDLAAYIGDALVKFRDWIDSILDFSGVIEKIVPPIQKAIEATKEWFKSLKDTKAFGKISSMLSGLKDSFVGWFAGLKDSWTLDNLVSTIKSAASAVKDWFASMKNSALFTDFLDGLRASYDSIKEWVSGIKDAENIPQYIVQGLVNGLWSAIKQVWNVVIELGKTILNAIKNVLGIHSPSTEFFDIAWNCILGFVNGIKAAIKMVWDTLGVFGSNLLTFIQNMDIGQLLSIIFSAGALASIFKLADALSKLASPFEGLGDVFEGVKKVLKSFSKVLNAFAFSLQAKAIKDIAIALLILAGAIIALTFFYDDDMWKAVGIIGALAVILALLAFAISKMNSASIGLDKTGLNIKGLNASLVGIAASLLLLAITVKMIGSLDPDQAKQGFLGLAGLVVAIGLVIAAYGLLVKGKSAQNIDKFGKTMTKMAIALLLMVAVVKLVGKLEWGEMGKGAAFLGGFLVFVTLLNVIALIPSKNFTALGKTMLKISVTLLLMVAIVKLVSKLTPDEMLKGAAFLGGFLVFVTLLNVIALIPSKNVENLGKTLLAISVSIAIMALIVKMLSGIKFESMAQGLIGVGVLTLFVMALIKIVAEAGPEAPKMAGTLIALSVAVGILAAIALILSLVDVPSLFKGIVAVGALGAIMALMIHATKGASSCVGNIVAMVVAIGLMTAAVIAMTFIDPTKLGLATLCLAALMAMFALLISVSSDINGSIGVLVTMTVAIGLLSAALVLLSLAPVQNTLGAAGALAIVMIALTGVLVALGAAQPLVQNAMTGVKGLLALSGVLLALTIMLLLLKNVNNAISSAIALGSLMAIMVGILALLGIIKPLVSNAITGAASLAIVSASLLILVLALNLMSGVQNAVSSAIALGILVAVMTGVMIALSKAGTNAVAAQQTAFAMIALAGALTILAIALRIMGGMTWSEMAIGLITIAGAFLIIGVAAFALQGLSPIILALAAAFLMIGVGVIAAGAGLGLVASGITALAAALSSSAATIVAGLSVLLVGLISLVPTVVQLIGTCIVTFCNMIIEAAPAIAMAIGTVLVTIVTTITMFLPTILTCIATAIMLLTEIVVPQLVQLGVTLITSFLNAMITLIPKVVELGVTLITNLLNAVITLIPKIVETGVAIVTALLEGLMILIPRVVDAGLKIVIGILEGIGNNIGKIIDMSVKIITEFIGGISRGLPKIIQAGIDLILSFINGLAEAINGNTQPMIDAVNNLMDAVINAIKAWFKNFVTKGSELVGELGSGIKNGATKAKNAISEVVKGVVSKIKEKFTDLKNAGKNIIDGFVQGIKDKASAVKDAATDLGKKALNSIKSFLGIESPSKEFAKIGRYADEGFIKGLDAYSRKVETAAENVGDSALSPIKNAISNIASALNSDMDMQPTIRPVLDLSAVRAGAGTIGGMLDTTASVGVAGSISSMMNGHRQNGNLELVSEIKKLRKDVGNLSNTSYNVNGVTYDDGSNISDAVKSLIRAAKIERRV